MPGLPVNVADEDSGYVSSSTSTLAGDESNFAGLNKPSAMAISTTPSNDQTRSQASSKEPSLQKLNPPSPSCNISSPGPFYRFPSDNDISPFCGPPVLLRVGGPASPSPETEPVSFFVHSTLLTRASAFFRAALSSHRSNSNNNSSTSYSFLEAQTHTVNLPEDRPDDVRFFLRWLYQGSCLGLLPREPEPSSASWSVSEDISSAAAAATAKHPTCPSAKMNNQFPRASLHTRHTAHLLSLHATYNRERRSLLPALNRHGAANIDISPLLPARPRPPAFGPLIRLYLFADRYGIGLGLKDLLVDLVREVAAAGNAVPGIGDVELLWRRAVGIALGGGSSMPGLKRLIVDLYMGMKTERLLASGEEVEVEEEEEVEVEEEVEEMGWDAGFLRDLVGGLRREVQAQAQAQAQEPRQPTLKTEGPVDGQKSSGRDAKGVEEGRVRVGRLVRNRCDYHDHDV